ncbi:MAG: hypothetical protein N3G21_06475 [Candidatus Hydrogenedentes bacterium]|nr:hypothetical protein [Candidatus Hydrogenedentota bacterium]
MFIRNTNIIDNPYTYYRLDPGEPGVAPPTPASQSAFTVFAQESRNRNRLQSEAILEGKDIIFVNTEYKVRKNGSFVTIVGGTTTVVSREKDNTVSRDIDDSQSPTSNYLQIENGDELRLNILKAEEQRLMVEKSTLKNKLNTSTVEQRKKIEKRIDEIDEKLKIIRNDIIKEKQRLQSSSKSFSSPPTYVNLKNPQAYFRKTYVITPLILALYG